MRFLALTALPLAAAKFLTFGDWGTGSTLQKENAANINAHCAVKGNCDFVVGLADNFYNGPLNVQDKRWSTEFSTMYTFDAPMYNCLGNHVRVPPPRPPRALGASVPR